MSSSPIIEQIRRQYIIRKFGYFGLLLLAALLLLAGIFYRWQPNFKIILLMLLPLLGVMSWVGQQFYQIIRTTPAEICRHLDRTRPELEESTNLLLRSPNNLSLLDRLQRQRIQPQLNQLDIKKAIPVSYNRAWQIAGVSILLTAGLVLVPHPKEKFISGASGTINAPAAKAIHKILPQVQQVSIKVISPAYTKRPPYTVKQPNFKAEEGAKITWEITTTGKVNTLVLAEAGKKSFAFQPVEGSSNRYRLSYPVNQSFIYTLDLNGKKSDYYAVEIIKDQPPTITVQAPAPFTSVAFGDPQWINIRATITDDYGIKNAALLATVAKGTGEAVKFEAVTVPLEFNFRDKKDNYSIHKKIDLKKLGLTYGDELYFYLQARDTYRGYTRTESFLVQLEDTTVAADFNGLAMGINKVSAYFRSQRQLIIDTEKLISEQKALDQSAFRNRSQDLGEEQKILRLRYGQFLGEEYETNLGGNPADAKEEHTDDDGHDHSGSGQNIQELLAPLVHQHDTEEDANFFEPAIKIKLKAALAQMWEAELRLRLSQPANALPFEYKALRLLKEVQQSARVYVRKTGFQSPPLRETEMRLTGDLTKIQNTEAQAKRVPTVTYPAIRQALPWLARQINGQNYDKSDAVLLQRAGSELAGAAINEPVRYLRALQNIRTLISEVQAGKKPCDSCLNTVMVAFNSLLPPPVHTPVAPNTHRHPLAEKYIRSIK